MYTAGSYAYTPLGEQAAQNFVKQEIPRILPYIKGQDKPVNYMVCSGETLYIDKLIEELELLGYTATVSDILENFTELTIRK